MAHINADGTVDGGGIRFDPPNFFEDGAKDARIAHLQHEVDRLQAEAGEMRTQVERLAESVETRNPHYRTTEVSTTEWLNLLELARKPRTGEGMRERMEGMKRTLAAICNEAIEEVPAPDNPFMCVWCGDCGETRDEIKHTEMCLIPKLAALASPAGDHAARQQRHYPCGCVTCVCDDDARCSGCGARKCDRPDSECDWRKAYPYPQGA